MNSRELKARKVFETCQINHSCTPPWVRLRRLERLTANSASWCSIQLSYRRVLNMNYIKMKEELEVFVFIPSYFFLSILKGMF